MANSVGMEEILQHLLVPDNTSIQQATIQIKAAFKDPNAIPELCRILGSSNDVQIRQYSAVLLRRKIQRRKVWKALAPNITQGIRDNILQILMLEPEKVIRKAISQLIGTMAKHDFNDNSWPGLLKFLVEHIQSPDPQQREIAVFLVNTICAAADDHMQPHLHDLMALLTPALDDQENIMVAFYATQAISELVYLSTQNDAKMFQAVIPKMLALIKLFIPKDDKEACEIMEYFDEVLESRVGIINPHIRTVVDFCLVISADCNICDEVRMKALSIISAAAENKKLILKHKLVEPILRVIFPIICSGTDQDDNIDAEDEVESSTPPAYSAQVISDTVHCTDQDDNIDAEDEVESSTPTAYSAQKNKNGHESETKDEIIEEKKDDQNVDSDKTDVNIAHKPPFKIIDTPVHRTIVKVVDMMALHLPPEKIIPVVMKMIQPAFMSSNPQERRAAYLTMAVTAEGCADYIVNKHMGTVLDLVVKGVEDPEIVVRNAAMFALGQFSEFLQPKISEYAAQLLPLLYKKIGTAAQEIDTNPSGITKTYYALEMFCENLGTDILPYLPGLMEHLMKVLGMPEATAHIKELVISAIGATANAAKEEMKVYFPQVMGELEKYLTDNTDEASSRLQIISIDTLAVFARQIGPETFLPLSARCLEFAINLLQASEDPDLRRCVYTLVAAVSNTTGSDMTQYLPVVVHHMLESLRSEEGVKTHFSKEKNPIEDIFNQLGDQDEEELGEDEDDDYDDDDDDEDDIKGISVENAYLDEKEDACTALGELALNTKTAFMPHIKECFAEVASKLDYPTSDVKKSAMTAATSFCIVVNMMFQNTPQAQPSPEVAEILNSMMEVLLPKLIEAIKSDPDREAVAVAVDNIQRLIAELKTKTLCDNQVTEQIILCIKNIFNHELPCQEQDEEGYSAGDNQAEFDGMLVESAGELPCQEQDEEGYSAGDNQAEFDGMLVESAGDVLPAIAAVIGGEMFLPVFQSTFLQFLIKKTKDPNSIAEHSFGYGIIAEVVKACGESVASLVDTLYPVFQQGLHDSDSEKDPNSIAERSFGYGIIAEVVKACGESVASLVDTLYPVFQQALHDSDSEAKRGSVLDKDPNSIAERSFGYGIIAEVVKACGESVASLVDTLYPVFQQGLHDTDSEVKRASVLDKDPNSIAERSFGYGIIAEVVKACGESVASLVDTLYPVFQQGLHDSDSEAKRGCRRCLIHKDPNSIAEHSFGYGIIAEVVKACGESVASLVDTLYPVFQQGLHDSDSEAKRGSVKDPNSIAERSFGYGIIAEVVKACGESVASLVDTLYPVFQQGLHDSDSEAKRGCVLDKDPNSIAERSFGYGIIAEVVKACGESVASLVDTLYPVFQQGLHDSDSEAKSNSIFGIGVLMSNCGPRYVTHYTEVLRSLFALLNSDVNPRVRDNICAAACRLILANKSAVPLQQTIEVIAQCLPLQEDFEENETVIKCLVLLYTTEPQLLLKHLPEILSAVSHVLGSREIDEDTEKLLIGFMQNLNQNYPSELKNVLTSLPQESSSKLNVCLGTV